MWASLALMVKNIPLSEDMGLILGLKTLENGNSLSIFAWGNPMNRGTGQGLWGWGGGYRPGSQRSEFLVARESKQ